MLEIELSEAERNEILNIAIFISESAELYGEMEANKELPIRKIAKEVLRTRKIIDSWKEYIIAYALIIGSYKYKNLNDYLRIVEVVDNNNEDQKVIHLKDIITENEEEIQQEDKNEEDHEDEIEEDSNKKEQSQEIKGVILSKSRKSAIVGMITGTLFMEVAAILANLFILLPAYGMPMEGAAAVNYVLYGLLPLNSIKAISVSILTYIIYKKVSVTIFKVDANFGSKKKIEES